jgi:hypothetical protein
VGERKPVASVDEHEVEGFEVETGKHDIR